MNDTTDLTFDTLENAPQAAARLEALAAAAVKEQSEAQGHWQTSQTLHEAFNDARATRMRLEAMASANPAEARTDDLERARAAERAAQRAFKDWQAEHKKGRKGAVTTALERVQNNLNQAIRKQTAFYDAKPPKAVRQIELLMELREALIADWRTHDNAPMPLADAQNVVKRQLNQLAAAGAPVVSFDSHIRQSEHRFGTRFHRSLRVVFPQKSLPIDNMPMIPDSEAFMAWLGADKLRDHALAELEAAYAKVKVTHTAESKRAALLGIETEIDLIERELSAAIWKEGRLKAFPSNIAWRAILLIE